MFRDKANTWLWTLLIFWLTLPFFNLSETFICRWPTKASQRHVDIFRFVIEDFDFLNLLHDGLWELFSKCLILLQNFYCFNGLYWRDWWYLKLLYCLGFWWLLDNFDFSWVFRWSELVLRGRSILGWFPRIFNNDLVLLFAFWIEHKCDMRVERSSHLLFLVIPGLNWTFCTIRLFS